MRDVPGDVSQKMTPRDGHFPTAGRWRRDTRALLTTVGALGAGAGVWSVIGSEPLGFALGAATVCVTALVSWRAVRRMWRVSKSMVVALGCAYGVANASIMACVVSCGALIDGQPEAAVSVFCAGQIAAVLLGGIVGLFYGVAYAALLATRAGPTAKVNALHQEAGIGGEPLPAPTLPPRSYDGALVRPFHIGLWLAALSLLCGFIATQTGQSFHVTSPRLPSQALLAFAVLMGLGGTAALARAVLRNVLAARWLSSVRAGAPGWSITPALASARAVLLFRGGGEASEQLTAIGVGDGPFREGPVCSGPRLGRTTPLIRRALLAGLAGAGMVAWTLSLIAQ